MSLNIEVLTRARENLHSLSLQRRLKVLTYEVAATHPLLATLLAKYQGIDKVYKTPEEFQVHFYNSARTIKSLYQQLQKRTRRNLGS